MTHIYLGVYYVAATVLSTLHGSFDPQENQGQELLLLHYIEAEAQRGVQLLAQGHPAKRQS